MLVVRDRDLRQWLAPAGEDAVRPHVASLVMSLKHESEDEEAREIKQRIFAADLADLPLFAVERACADFRQGRAGDRKWMPTQAQVREVAERYAGKLREERADVRAVLEAKVVEPRTSEESRAREIERWHRIRAEIVAKADPFGKPHGTPYSQVTPTEAQAALDRKRDAVEAGSVDPIVMSDELRAILAKPREI